jgi:DNA-binding transcriptional MocR family regulator
MNAQIAPTLTLPLPELASQFLLKDDIVFLNHGSFGACPRPVFEEYQRWQRELEGDPVDFLGRRVQDLMLESKKELAAYLNAPAEQLVFVPNATHGINIVARSLQLEPGDEILTTNHEYGAVNNTWRFKGCQVHQSPDALPHDNARGICGSLVGRRHATHEGHHLLAHHVTDRADLPRRIDLPTRQGRGHSHGC